MYVYANYTLGVLAYEHSKQSINQVPTEAAPTPRPCDCSMSSWRQGMPGLAGMRMLNHHHPSTRIADRVVDRCGSTRCGSKKNMQDNKFLTSAATEETIATCEIRVTETYTLARSPTYRVQCSVFSAPHLLSWRSTMTGLWSLPDALPALA